MLPEHMDPNDLIGVVKHKARWQIFSGTVAEWILDYSSYDPTSALDPSHEATEFRGHLLLVDSGNADRFLQVMADYELQAMDLGRFIRQDGPCNWPLCVLVDFDDKFYVNGFSEIPLHDYLPPGWRGGEGSPLDFAPETIQRIWASGSDDAPRSSNAASQ